MLIILLFVLLGFTAAHDTICPHQLLFNGTWDDVKIRHRGEQELSSKNNAVRFHSSAQEPCSLSDFLKASTDPVVRGHLTEAIESEMLLRFLSIRDKTWLTFGTSIDHRNLRIGCPVFGQERELFVHKYEGLSIILAHCRIPVLGVTLAYVFGGPLSLASTQEKAKLYNATHEAMGMLNMSDVGFITLSGIEWDLKDNGQVNATTYEKAVRDNIGLISNLWPAVNTMSLRTQYFSVDKNEKSLGTVERFRELNQVFHKVARESHETKTHPRVLISDMRHMMRFNGTWASGWTDGLHPGHWVTLQYTNLVLHQMSDALA